MAATSRVYKEITCIDDALVFLTQKPARRSLNVFYNIAFDFEALFKWEPQVLRDIAASGSAFSNGYRIRYIPKKCLTITDRNRNTYKYYDIAQFFSTSLATASTKYLQEEPHELKSDRNQLFSLHPISKIGEYCRDDACKTQRLGSFLLSGLRGVGVDINKLYSAGYCSQVYALQHANIPKVSVVPRHILRLYWDAYRGGWFDTYVRGSFSGTAYDINSAYPDAMRLLPDVSSGNWVCGYDENASLGVMYCKVSGGENNCNTLATQVHGTNIYPIFNTPHNMALTLSEYSVLKEFYSIKPLLSFYFRPTPQNLPPYQQLVDTLYSEKKRYEKTDARYLTVKLVLNSLYGKTAELRKREDHYTIGNLWNPVYAAETTARTRIKMFLAVREHSEHIASILTDAVCFTKPIPLKTSDKLGAFSQTAYNEKYLVLRTGVYEVEGKVAATRGFSRSNVLRHICDTSSPIITTKSLRPSHFSECIVQDRLEDVAVFREEIRELDLNAEIKRVWYERIYSARELLERSFSSSAVPSSTLPL